MWVVHWNILALSTRTATNLRPSHSLPAFWHSPRWPIHPIPSMDKNDLVGMLFQPSPKLWGHQLAKKWGHPLCQKPVASFGIFRIFQGRIFPKENGGITIPIAIAGIRPLLAKWPCYLDLHPPGAGRDCRCWVWIKILYSDWMVNTIRKD